MVKFTEKLKDLSSLAVTDISAIGISAIFWFYMATVLGPKGYGEITFLLAIAQIGSTVSLLGSANALVVYTAKGVKIQSALYVLTLISGTIASIVIYFFVLNTGPSFVLLGYVIFALVTSELLGRKLYRTYSKHVLIQRAFMVILAVGLYNVLGESGVLIGIAISYSPYIYGLVKVFKTTKINFPLVKERFNFLIFSYMQTLTGTISGSIDKIIIGPMLGFGLLGNYSLGLQIFTLLTLLPLTVGKYIIPQDSSGIENKKLKKLVILFSIGLTILGLTIGPPIISWIFPKFIEAQDVIRIISLATIPSTITMTYNSKFLGHEKSKHLLFGSLTWAITQISGIFILGSIFGVNGVAAALVIASSCSTIYAVIADKLDNKTKNV